MTALDQHRTAVGKRRKAVEELVIEMGIHINDGMDPAIVLHHFCLAVREHITPELIQQHREKMARRGK